MVDDRRALGSGVEFTDERVAVKHQHALFDGYDLYPVPAKVWLIFHFFRRISRVPWQSTFSTHAPAGYSQRDGWGS